MSNGEKIRCGLPAQHVVTNIWKQHVSQCIKDISQRRVKGAFGKRLTKYQEKKLTETLSARSVTYLRDLWAFCAEL